MRHDRLFHHRIMKLIRRSVKLYTADHEVISRNEHVVKNIHTYIFYSSSYTYLSFHMSAISSTFSWLTKYLT